ncbi:MAG TPA: anti-sigma factor [Candidatus Binatia bacterium]|jgi:anti-sigma factor RsiW|nr:anti-sigma factor [Candidatus Binatia bacterium]
MSCRAMRERLAAYADDELGVEAALDIEGHLERCPSCRDALGRQRDFHAAVGRLYLAPRMPDGPRRALLRRLHPRHRWRQIGIVSAAVAASLVAAVWVLRMPGIPADVQAAIVMHETAEHGTAPLELTSSDLPTVNRWLRGSVPFAGEVAPGPAEFRLRGAAAVDLVSVSAAWVLYQHGTEPVSLFVLPPRQLPDVGRSLTHKGIDFRTIEVGDHRVTAWNHDPVSYLLVSARDRPPAEACAVCHAGPGAPALAGFAVSDGR